MPDACYMCGSSDLYVWDAQNGIDLWMCNDCGHGWAPVDEPVETQTEENYDEEYYGQMGYDRKWRFRIGRAHRWLAYLGEINPPPGNLLDIGSSMGYCLDAGKALGWTPYGTDVSQYAIKVCRERGLKVFYSNHPDDFPQWLPKLDAVTATHVIEHVADPIDYLTKLREWMAPGGTIYVQLPNFPKRLRRGPDVPYVGPPAHLHFFTIDTARSCLQQAGWQVVQHPRLRIGYAGLNPWRWLKELLYEAPRELIRQPFTRNGMLSNIHLFARVSD